MVLSSVLANDVEGLKCPDAQVPTIHHLCQGRLVSTCNVWSGDEELPDRAQRLGHYTPMYDKVHILGHITHSCVTGV